VPWDQIQVSSDLSRVTIPVTEETVEDYSGSYVDGFLQKAETGQRRIVESDLATGARVWKATELIGDDAFLNDNAGYGNITDLVFTSDGNLHAVVVNAYAGYGGGYRAFPFYGYRYGWSPGYPNYYLGYDRNDIAVLPILDFDKMNNDVTMKNEVTTTGSGSEPDKSRGRTRDSQNSGAKNN
jgi:hypothetical protein